MSDCDRFERAIEDHVAGPLDASLPGPLLAHCRDCADCQALLELHRDLAALARDAPEPGDATFDALSRRVLRGAGGADGSPAAAPATAGRRPLSAAVGWRLAAAAVAAAVVFAAGIAAGRAWISPGPRGGNGGVTGRLIEAIGTEAAAHEALADIADSRFTYSNVSFRRIDDRRVGLDFDVATHLQLVEPVHSELVREVLVHSLLNPSTTGARLKALSYAAGNDERKVREALLFAMRRDESLAVRLGALTILADQLDFPEVQEAVLGALRDDAAVQMRLTALEALARHRVDRERMRHAIQKEERPGNEALLVRLAEFDDQL